MGCVKTRRGEGMRTPLTKVKNSEVVSWTEEDTI